MDKTAVFVAKCGNAEGMFVEKADKRHVATHKRIRETFENLILVHPYHMITVSMLVQEVGINRKTFYLHFPSLDALVDELVDDIAAEIVDYMGLQQLQFSQRALEGYLQMLDQKLPLHRRLICSPEYSFVYHRVCDTVVRRRLRQLQAPLDLADFRLYAAMEAVSLIVMQTYRSWLLADMPLTTTELAALINRLLTDNILSMLRNKQQG